ncbi:uncharacterized protein LOC132162940 [Corylus avellana]|uniref:uncharacterized protein LOC132162940 n=1 Tax=Corylus avellana TaxID=13451 RepID=UPI00286BDFF6|nr:uncharacterized protein LOC132162940 [Corylus avellana]
MEALGDANTKVIGVYGMAGAGKTTLVREVARRAKEKKLFDEVASAYVTQSPNLTQIQGEIAYMLDLKLDAEIVSERADRLRKRLTTHKKILIILDDIWSKLDLEKIGISCTQCKVVLTSRDKNVLSCEMGTQKDFELVQLPQKEAWNLFEKMAGDCVKDPNLRSTAAEVAKECADIDNLEQAKDRLYSLVQNLKDKSLLLDCPHSSEHCHMHDVVRYVARFIASSDHNMFVVSDRSGLKKWTDADSLRRCRAFSISGGDIHELPNKMECPDLRFFYVYGGDRALHIPETFFEGMGKLQVLDLTEMKLPSLGLLIKLQTLCLDHCLLGDIAVIGELKNLVILSLLSSNLSQLPREIALLTRLRLLDLSNCFKLEVIPPNVLSSLVELEELYMGNSPVQWESEGLNSKRNNASLAELKHLSQLTTLEIHIIDVRNLPKDLLFERLKGYAISVGDHVWDSSNKREASKILKLKLNTSFQSEVGIKLLLKRTEALYLDELRDVKSLLNQLGREGFQQLKHLHIQNNPEIQYIINLRIPVVAFPALETFLLKNMMSLEEIYHGQLPLTSFHNLRIVKVEHCDKLKFLFSSSMARGLSHLEELEVRECRIMGAIVIEEEGKIEDNDTSLFPKLRHLALEHLPKLMGFLITQNPFITDAGEIISEGKFCFHIPILHEQVVFPILETLELSSVNLEEIEQNQHPESSSMTGSKQLKEMNAEESPYSVMQPFFNEEVVFPILERLELSSVNLAEIEQNQHPARSYCILRNTQATSRFENLSYLQVQGMGNIKYILSFSTARFMVQLKHLHVLECEDVEEILVREELRLEEEITPEVLFPRLECLFLKELPILKRFCVGSNIEFPSLENLKIEHCPKVVTFVSKPLSSGMTISKELKEMTVDETPHNVMQPLFNEESLDTLIVANCGVEEIVAREKGSEAIARFVFPQITSLCLEKLPQLKWFYPGMHASEWPMLKSLTVNGCQKVDIFAFELLSFQETLQESPVEIAIKQPLFLVDQATFPKLEFLELVHYHTIWRGQFLEDCFCKLKVLRLMCNHNKSAVSPPNFVKRLHNLEKFVVCHSDWEEIFPYEELPAQENHVGVPTQLRELNLNELPKLTHLWNEDTKPCSNFHIMEILVVSNCGILKILVPSSVSFQNLSELEILECHGLINLVTSSTAKSLVQLKKMSVSECEMIMEIVSGDRGEGNDQVITFSKLTSLKLDCLPQLSNFCSGGYSFEFPSLEEVIVSQCQEMKIFSVGVLSTPKLKRVQATKEDEGQWKGDLNTTLHWLWKSKLCIPPSNDFSETE